MEHRADIEMAAQASPSTTNLDNSNFSDESSAAEGAEDVHPGAVNANLPVATGNVIIAHTTPIDAIASGLEADICK